MTITSAEYKLAIEAKIAASSGATALKDLTMLKANADLWLLNNSAGTITGYSALEALIQAEQDSLVVGSPNLDLTLVGASIYPPKASSSAVYTPDEFFVSAIATSTPAGILLTVTPEDDECVCLQILIASTATQTNVQVEFGSRIIVPAMSLGYTTSPTADSLFSIGPQFPSGIADSILGRPGEPLVVKKTSGATTQVISIKYSIGKLI